VAVGGRHVEDGVPVLVVGCADGGCAETDDERFDVV
jgi:hypothetical protein